VRLGVKLAHKLRMMEKQLLHRDAAHHAHHDHLPHHLVCQVSLQLKLAHKLKLTEKQLLHWMLPIMPIMIIYLTTWSVR
jgi:hypothetical protein